MQYEVEIAGRRWQVVVARTGDDIAVTVNGHTRQVDAARILSLWTVCGRLTPVSRRIGPAVS